MNTLKLAVKATLEHFADFVSESAGFKTDKNGAPVLDKETGKPIPVNARGNLPFTVEGISFTSDEDCAEYCAAHGIAVREVIAAAVNDSKGLAARAAVGEVSKQIPKDTPTDSANLEIWKNKAQEAATVAADKTAVPDVSSRMAKAGLEASIAAFEEKARTTPATELSQDEKDAFIANVLAFRAM